MVGAAVMELPDLSAWQAGMEHDEEAFNAVTYALNFLLDPPECRINQTTAQAVANSTTTNTAMTFQSASLDNDGMWDAGHPTYLTIQTPGWYEVEFAMCWATKADTTLRTQALTFNGDLALNSGVATAYYINDGAATPQISQSYDMFLNTGDQLGLGALQNSGASLNSAPSASIKDQQIYLRVRWSAL